MRKWIEEMLQPMIVSGSKGGTVLSSEGREKLLSHIEYLEARCRVNDSYIDHLEMRYGKMEQGIKRLHDHPALQVELLKASHQPHEHLIIDSDVLYELKGLLTDESIEKETNRERDHG